MRHLRPKDCRISSFAWLGITAVWALSGVLPAAEPEAQRVVEFDSVWRFHDGDEDLGTEWRELDYDDSDWGEGPGVLGYDTSGRTDRWPEPGLQTEVAENLLVYYFRIEFEYTGDVENRRMLIEQIIDDGAVYYLNGEEIARSALMPEGEVGFETQTTSATNPWNTHDTLEVMNPPLRKGRNVLAASVHNRNRTSSDIALALQVSISERLVDPVALYLSWQSDPTTTMTIQWHTEGEVADTVIEHAPLGTGDFKIAEPQSHPMVFSDRYVHTVEITRLEPNSEHSFRIRNLKDGLHSRSYKFRTMPTETDRPIRVAIGGDVRHTGSMMRQVNLVAMRYDPDFIIWGGDLAYSDGRPDRVDREYDFFQVMTETLVTEDGRVVPVIMGIGNHEIVGHYYWGADRGRESYEDTDEYREEIAPYYYNLIAFPGHPGYGVLDFGDYMSIILLDTDHSGPIEGTQTEWLAETLAERGHVRHIFPVYHVPGYPSVRPFSGATSRRVRENWIPLFEEAGVRLAFENHDHAYKRTVPIRGGEEDETGIVFMGDGAWGVGERIPRDPDDEWYLARTQSIRHVILLTLQDDFLDLKVIDREGRLIDHYIPRRQNSGSTR